MLPLLYRFYFWGVHGVFVEVVFTALWQYVEGGSLSLSGQSSIWSFLTYGIGSLWTELLRELMLARVIPTWARCLLYVPLVFAWEFSCGALLRYFNACPWDYSDFDYDVMGLITLEYAPLWLVCAAYFEFLMSYLSVLEQKPLWRQKLQ